MFDDDYPDYYLGDDDEAPRRSRRIDFAPQTADREDEEDDEELHDETVRAVTVLAALVVVAASLTVYFRYLTPYIQESVVTGTVLGVERRGLIFKTYEATVLMPDGTTAEVSVASEDVARKMQALQGTDTQVNFECERYYGAAPWRGKSTTVVTGMRTIGEGKK